MKSTRSFFTPYERHRYPGKSYLNGWRFAIIPLYLLFSNLTNTALGQANNADFERVKLNQSGWHYTGIELSSDDHLLFTTTREVMPLKVINLKSRQVTGEYNAGNWPTGAKISASGNGSYLLLQEQGYNLVPQNRLRSIDFEIISASSGKRIKLFGKVQDVVISADEKFAISLNHGEVAFWNLPEATKERSFMVPLAGNAVELTADGKTIVVSQSLTNEDFKGDSRYYKKKKAVRFAVRYKQRINFYDALSFERIKTVDELYDLIYNFRFSPDGSQLLAFQNPDLKAQTTKKGITYINLVNTESREPIRLGFTSQSTHQPDLRFSHDGKYFAINSSGNKFQEILLYSMEDGSLLNRFELGYRLFEKSEGEKIINDSRPSFLFLPGDKSILIAMGNQMIVWNLESN